jgi:hypothetical protein
LLAASPGWAHSQRHARSAPSAVHYLTI